MQQKLHSTSPQSISISCCLVCTIYFGASFENCAALEVERGVIFLRLESAFWSGKEKRPHIPPFIPALERAPAPSNQGALEFCLPSGVFSGTSPGATFFHSPVHIPKNEKSVRCEEIEREWSSKRVAGQRAPHPSAPPLHQSALLMNARPQAKWEDASSPKSCFSALSWATAGARPPPVTHCPAVRIMLCD